MTRRSLSTIAAATIALTSFGTTRRVTGLTFPPPTPMSPPSVAEKGTTFPGENLPIATQLDPTDGGDVAAASGANAGNGDDIEEEVIASIRTVARDASNLNKNPKQFLASLGDFGGVSGALIAQKWLTPEALEECALFWDDGFRALMRDLFRSYLFSKKSTRYGWRDWTALGWFLSLASGSSLIFLPLLLPLIRVAVEDIGENGIDETVYLPPSFRTRRLTAMRRLRRPSERPLGQYLTDGSPRNLKEGISFFQDGTSLLLRDLRRGELTTRTEDTWGSYGRFALLAFSSFPLTPLILPLIDRRRGGEGARTSDYVPSSYRPERLGVVARLRSVRTARFGTSSLGVLRAAADGEARPPPERLLEAIVRAQRESVSKDRFSFLGELAGMPGRRWELAYIASKPAVIAMRRRMAEMDGIGEEPWYRPTERLLFPWTRLRDGLYVNSNLVSAIQNFDAGTMRNKNGVFRVLGSDWLQTTVEGPFSWDGACRPPSLNEVTKGDGLGRKTRSAGVCAFRPTTATFRLGPLEFDQEMPEETPFDRTPMRELPFFKFIHVDDKVAVAMGRSGGVALWRRMSEESTPEAVVTE